MLNRTRFPALALTAMLLFTLFGCGGGGSSSNNAGSLPSVGTPVSWQSKLAVMDAVIAKVNSLPGQDFAADNQAILAYLKSRPEIAQAGLAGSGCVWAQFQDGMPYAVLHNPRPASGRSVSTFVPTVRTHITRAAELPAANKVRLYSIFGGPSSGYPDATDIIAGYFKAAGYPAASVEVLPATLDNLKDLKGAGVVYFTTHGGAEVPLDPHYLFGMKAAALGTATPITTADDKNPEIQDWLKQGYITVVTEGLSFGPDGKEVLTNRYAITNRFIQHYWIDQGTLAKDSCVFFDACESGSPLMQVALGSRARAFFGYEGPENSSIPARFLFDRLLGSNAVNPVENPPQRPFDYQKVWDDLVTRGLAITTDDNGTQIEKGHLNYFKTETGLLSPTIAYMDVDETQKSLTINGSFGTDPGVTNSQVFVGGKEMTSRTWQPDKIVVNNLPISGDGAAGDVYVQSLQRKSNVVQLTEWNFHITYALTSSDTLRVDGGFDIHFRADIHTYRDKPAERPNYRVVNFQCARDTKGKMTASGSNKVGTGTTIWSGAADILPPYDTTPQNVLICFGTIVNDVKVLKLALVAESTNGLKQIKDGKESLLAASTGKLDSPFSAEKPFPSLSLVLGDDFSIPKDSRSEDITSSTKLKLSWDATPAHFPPAPDAKRSVTVR